MQLGIYSFGDVGRDTDGNPLPVATVLAQTLERIQLADELGLGFYGLGEHHIPQYAISSPGTVLAAAASVTKQITLATAVTVLSTEDPVRLYQQFTTLDQLSRGRAEILAGRGSFTESFPLYGASLKDYDELYAEKLGLLLALDSGEPVTWSGRFRAPLKNAEVLPRPYGEHLKIAVATGGNPQSSIRAGMNGLPVVYAHIGGEPERFAQLAELYRRAAQQGGHDPDALEVTMSSIGFIADTTEGAIETFHPHWLQVMEYGAEARGWQVPSRADYDHMVAGASDYLVGDPELVASRIIDVARAMRPARYGLQFDWAGPPHDDVMRSIELFGREVKPIVDAALAEQAVTA
jgi:probable LLM family oxidoreductase